MRSRTPAAALIEGNDAVHARIEITAAVGVTSRPRPAVHKDHRQAVGRTAFVDIQDMRPINSKIVPGVGFDLREQGLHYTLRGRVEVIPGGDFKK